MLFVGTSEKHGGPMMNGLCRCQKALGSHSSGVTLERRAREPFETEMPPACEEFPNKHGPLESLVGQDVGHGGSFKLVDSFIGRLSFAQAGAGDPLWPVELWEKKQVAGAHFSSEISLNPGPSRGLSVLPCPSTLAGV